MTQGALPIQLLAMSGSVAENFPGTIVTTLDVTHRMLYMEPARWDVPHLSRALRNTLQTTGRLAASNNLGLLLGTVATGPAGLVHAVEVYLLALTIQGAGTREVLEVFGMANADSRVAFFRIVGSLTP